jgi:quercetin dioxygenase-like cupin family protein
VPTSEVIKLGPDQTVRVLTSTTDLLELESTWAPHSAVPPRHLHPLQEEHFEVLEGDLTVRVGQAGPRLVRAGKGISVPRGAAHAMWNAGAVPARAVWRITPALRTERLFREMEGGMPVPRAARVFSAYTDEYRLAVPFWLQRAAFAVLALFDRPRDHRT